jgi:phenylalanyl-tRNA synthetase beta chain
MRVSLKWLRDYLNIDISGADLANRLCMAGNEVKAVEVIGGAWNECVVIGQITAINPHPNADRLRLASVTTGGEQHVVVCGAPNLTIGDKIVFATLGAELKDGHTGQVARLKPAKIRGVESKGMVCSEMELGISQNHEGILVLPVDAPLGMPLKEYLGDIVIDLDVTPNRPDCLSVIGIAREAAALTGQQVRLVEPVYAETESSIQDKIAIEIQAPDLCPRYSASLIEDIKIMPSPRWMQDRLTASGMRPINNIVDISNYVMLEYGNPLHTFDYDKIVGKKIIVRRAKEEEVIVSLDGVERKLNSGMLVIADAARAVAVAGVMGGANSEVTEQTKNILLEAASFNQFNIHNTGSLLNLPSEARYRFERGIAAGLTVPALKRATQLIAELGAGKVCQGYMDVFPGKKSPEPILLSSLKMERLLGKEYSEEEITNTLGSLGFECRKTQNPGELSVIAPYWRSDIHLEVDLIEEVARITGYDKIPTTLLAEPIPHQNKDNEYALKGEIRQGLVADGFCEVLNFSLTSLDMLKKIDSEQKPVNPLPMRVANPMTAEMEYLRTSFRPMLLNSFAANRRFETGSIRLFEVGKVYIKKEKGQPDERETVCGVMGGLRFAKSWQDNEQNLDFYDAKGVIEGLLLRFGLNPGFKKGQDAGLHPNKQAEIYLGDKKIGVVGEVHPKVLFAFEIVEAVYLLEMDLKALVSFSSVEKSYKSVPKFPSIVRDMALIVDAQVTHQTLLKSIQSFSLVEQAEIFDVYSGGQVPAGKKSLAYRISYRSPNHTLVDEEVNQIHQKILDRLKSELGAELRS